MSNKKLHEGLQVKSFLAVFTSIKFLIKRILNTIGILFKFSR